jgi:hypothetical protein
VERERIARYSLLGGEQALASFDAEAAPRHFERGLGAKGPAADDAETAWLRFGLARALFPTPFFTLATEEEPPEAGGRAFAALASAFDCFVRVGDAASAAKVAEHPLSFVSRSGECHSLFDQGLRLA